jgi:hypothetical protein
MCMPSVYLDMHVQVQTFIPVHKHVCPFRSSGVFRGCLHVDVSSAMCMHMHVCARPRVCACVSMNLHGYVCMYICIRIRICVCVYIYIYVYIYMRTTHHENTRLLHIDIWSETVFACTNKASSRTMSSAFLRNVC